MVKTIPFEYIYLLQLLTMANLEYHVILVVPSGCVYSVLVVALHVLQPLIACSIVMIHWRPIHGVSCMAHCGIMTYMATMNLCDVVCLVPQSSHL